MSNFDVRENLTSVTPIYTFVFGFEEKFSPEKSRTWMSENWLKGFYFCGAYLFLIFSMQYCMRNRPRFNLKKILITWNVVLAAFSILGTIRTLPELYHMISNKGLYHSVCASSFVESNKVVEFWAWMFALSKLVEFGDTIFVVLRKQPLIFLHWYHHFTTLMFIWCIYQEYTASLRWFMVMNFFVHSLMYSYYALRAMGFSLPKFIMITITSLQIIQMIIGCFISYMSYAYLSGGRTCLISAFNVKLSSFVYFAFLLLFSRFFYSMYLSPSGRKKQLSKPGSTRIYVCDNRNYKTKSQ